MDLPRGVSSRHPSHAGRILRADIYEQTPISGTGQDMHYGQGEKEEEAIRGAQSQSRFSLENAYRKLAFFYYGKLQEAFDRLATDRYLNRNPRKSNGQKKPLKSIEEEGLNHVRA